MIARLTLSAHISLDLSLCRDLECYFLTAALVITVSGSLDFHFHYVGAFLQLITSHIAAIGFNSDLLAA